MSSAIRIPYTLIQDGRGLINKAGARWASHHFSQFLKIKKKGGERTKMRAMMQRNSLLFLFGGGGGGLDLFIWAV